MDITWHVRSVGTLICVLSVSLLSGCVAQQADLKSAERRMKESNDALAQRGAQQRQELEELKSQELPKLRGELERAQHQAQEIQRAQDDLRQRSQVLEQQTKKLEQLSAKFDADNANEFTDADAQAGWQGGFDYKTQYKILTGRDLTRRVIKKLHLENVAEYNGTAVAPESAPEAVKLIIAAGNAIHDLPYKYGGGHGNWNDTGYDCSGSVSFAFHGAGMLTQALDSTGFMSWGDPGEGQWITVYANPGHAYMVVAGLRFDTSGRVADNSRWHASMRSSSGYTVRHPPGL